MDLPWIQLIPSRKEKSFSYSWITRNLDPGLGLDRFTVRDSGTRVHVCQFSDYTKPRLRSRITQKLLDLCQISDYTKPRLRSRITRKSLDLCQISDYTKPRLSSRITQKLLDLCQFSDYTKPRLSSRITQKSDKEKIWSQNKSAPCQISDITKPSTRFRIIL